MYRCEEAVASFRGLPLDQQHSGWVLCQVPHDARRPSCAPPIARAAVVSD
jgi:hypothetical protein